MVSQLLRPVPLLIVILGFVLLIWSDPSSAAEAARRLKIDIELRRDGAVQQGADRGKGHADTADSAPACRFGASRTALRGAGEDKVRLPTSGGRAEASMHWRFDPM